MPANELVHYTHCNQGEHVGWCKYGDPDCPALRLGFANADDDEKLMVLGRFLIKSVRDERDRYKAALEEIACAFGMSSGNLKEIAKKALDGEH